MNFEERVAHHVMHIEQAIREHGWAVHGVFAAVPDEHSFAYTIGLTRAGLPELLVAGVSDARVGASILNAVAKAHLKETLAAGSEIRLDEVVAPLRVIEAPLAEIDWAKEVCGGSAYALQLVWPDDDGNWPATPTWDEEYKQELFGPASW